MSLSYPNPNEKTESSVITGTKGKILIVEGNDTLRNMLSGFLKTHGYIAKSAINGMDAYGNLTSDNFDVIISNIVLPGMDGVEFLRETKEKFGDIPMILITDKININKTHEAVKQGVFDYILQPLADMTDILHSVNRAVITGRLQKEKENLLRELDRKNIHLKNVVRELDSKNESLDLLVQNLQKAVNLGGIMMKTERNAEKLLEGINPELFRIFGMSTWGVLFYYPDGQNRIVQYVTRPLQENDKKNLVSMMLKDFYRASEILLSEDGIEIETKENILDSGISGDKEYYSQLLEVGEKVLGLVYLVAEQNKKQEDSLKHTFTLIAGQMSAALENIDLFENQVLINKELKELSEFKDEVLGIAAHDLRSPITAISMTGTLLRDYGDRMKPHEKEESINGIIEKSRHMIRMINELLDITVVESGNLVLFRKPVNIGDLIDDICRQTEPVARAKEIRLRCEFPDNLPEIEADKNKIKEVLDNLVSNAIKYTHPDGTVKIGAKQQDESILVWVSDNGVGIKESEKEKLFKKFSRTSSLPTGGETSIGLGLAIVKKIVDLHGGKIWVESEENKGSVFYFTLPVEPGNVS
jgi:signal transduction histidine kinase/DNA-binding response OmpR family regulator